MTKRTILFTTALTLLAWVNTGCEQKVSPPATTQPVVQTAKPEHKTALLMGQAQFVASGNSRVPGPAKLSFIYPEGDKWTVEVVEDASSNVFHKVMPFDLPGQKPGILTIGANKAPLPAILKAWRLGTNGWKDEELYRAEFGGKFNRLRDIEIGDVTGDGKPDMVIATHDQGVVLVLENKNGTWQATEIDRTPNMFVHEIEIGDVDGDGKNEIYATPSEPNVQSGEQSGHIVTYRFDGNKFNRQVVEDFKDRHVKEIFAADVDGKGRTCLFAPIELGMNAEQARVNETGVEIKRYRVEGGKYVGEVIASLPDRQCRFLNAGDVDSDGKIELIASCYKAGVWMLRQKDEKWTPEQIDAESSGYEHATALADLDGDGKLEIYVAADDQQTLRRYRWNGAAFDRSDVAPLTKGNITFGLLGCTDAQCLAVQ